MRRTYMLTLELEGLILQSLRLFFSVQVMRQQTLYIQCLPFSSLIFATLCQFRIMQAWNYLFHNPGFTTLPSPPPSPTTLQDWRTKTNQNVWTCCRGSFPCVNTPFYEKHVAGTKFCPRHMLQEIQLVWICVREGGTKEPNFQSSIVCTALAICSSYKIPLFMCPYNVPRMQCPRRGTSQLYIPATCALCVLYADL